MKRLLRSAGVASLLLPVLLAGPTPAHSQLPDEFTNLQVLPEDMPPRQLVGVMRGFSVGLGVRCWYCHVGEEGQPLSEYDFASDDKPEKRKARFMLEMSMQLNDDILPGIAEFAERAEPGLRVQCVTCHRGVPLPRQIQDIVTQTAAADGVDAAIAEYRALRERHYGTAAYDFGEQPLIDAAGELSDDPAAALAVFDLALEHFPESIQALVGSAQVHQVQGDADAARAALLRAQEIQPNNPQIMRMLERLGNP